MGCIQGSVPSEACIHGISRRIILRIRVLEVFVGNKTLRLANICANGTCDSKEP